MHESRRVLKVLVRWVHHSTHEQDGTCENSEKDGDKTKIFNKDGDRFLFRLQKPVYISA